MEKSQNWWQAIERVVGIVMTVIGIGGISDDLDSWRGWLSQNGPSWSWWALLVVGLALILRRSFIYHFIVPAERKRPLSPPEELMGPVIANRTLKLIDAARSGFIQHKRFEDCIIVGPAMLLPIGMLQITECALAPPGGLRATLWEEPTGREFATGPVVADDVAFLRCMFIGVGFYMPKDQIDHLLALDAAGAKRLDSSPFRAAPPVTPSSPPIGPQPPSWAPG